MNELVLRHTYADGMTSDLSTYRNHGFPTGVVAGSGDFAGSFRFDGAGSRIVVPPSESLADLRAVRARVRFWYEPDGAPRKPRPTWRFGRWLWLLRLFPGRSPASGGTVVPLIGADQSFGIWIDGSQRLIAGLTYPGTPTATASVGGAPPPDSTSSEGLPFRRLCGGTVAVTPRAWNVAEWFHDGVGHARLYLNGAVVGETFDMKGPVRSVGPGGIHIGEDPFFTSGRLHGYIDDFALYRYDPENDVGRLIDRCCMDRARLDELLGELAESGWDLPRLKRKVEDVLRLGGEAAAALRDGSPEQTAKNQALTREAMLALKLGDVPGLESAFARLDHELRSRLSEAELNRFAGRALAQLEDWPWDLARMPELAGALCWGAFVPAANGPDEKPKPSKEKHGPWSGGDPDTDRAQGTPPKDWEIDPGENGGDRVRRASDRPRRAPRQRTSLLAKLRRRGGAS